MLIQHFSSGMPRVSIADSIDAQIGLTRDDKHHPQTAPDFRNYLLHNISN